MTKQEELIDLLVKSKLIGVEQLAKIKNLAASSQEDLDSILIKQRIVDSEELTKVKAQLFKLPYQLLLNQKVEDQALNVIPLEVAENYKIICLKKEGNKIRVGN